MAPHLASNLLFCKLCGSPFVYKLKQPQTKLKSGLKTDATYHAYAHKPNPECTAQKEYPEASIDTCLETMYFDYLLHYKDKGKAIQLAQLIQKKARKQAKLIQAIKDDTASPNQAGLYFQLLEVIQNLQKLDNPWVHQRQAHKSYLLYLSSSIEIRIKLITKTLGSIIIEPYAKGNAKLYSPTSPKAFRLKDIDKLRAEYLTLMEELATFAGF